MVVLLGLTLALTLGCVWIVVPPWSPATIVAAVLAIECSPYLFLVNAALLILIARIKPGRRPVVPLILAIANVCISTLPGLALLTGGYVPSGQKIPSQPVRVTTVKELAIPVTLGDHPSAIRAYLPQTSAPAPIVIAIYGGAWRHGDPSKDAALNGALARQGYAVFALNYRHSPQYRYPVALRDVRKQISLIEREALGYGADPSRIALLGHSSGGELALLSAFATGSSIRAVVSYSGAVDLAMGFKFPPHPDPIGVPSLIHDYIGQTPGEAPGRYAAASPLTSVRSGLPPALLIYGARDHVVDIRYAWKLRDALLAHRNSVTFVQFPWAEHGFEEVPFGLHAQIAQIEVKNFLAVTLAKR
ncbi:MAG: alpha/beta hydrolase [Candidatus Eremiobacteraeota bacterium]|nr:alpha/beta hydrolase [Candidatus Eremiobacteraeota bacterium]